MGIVSIYLQAWKEHFTIYPLPAFTLHTMLSSQFYLSTEHKGKQNHPTVYLSKAKYLGWICIPEPSSISWPALLAKISMQAACLLASLIPEKSTRKCIIPPSHPLKEGHPSRLKQHNSPTVSGELLSWRVQRTMASPLALCYVGDLNISPVWAFIFILAS